MRHLTIKNFGPLDEVSIELGRINLIIGLQSSGKSCVLKTACYCTWVEKRLEITQENLFGKNKSSFIDTMADYYQMKGYIHPDTFIEYETEYLKFSYDHATEKFTYKWKKGRWNYRRPKVSYIPADRNLVVAIPGWRSLELDGNMLEFISDWDKARKFVTSEKDFLGTGLSYRYDSKTNSDRIETSEGQVLSLKESSSGLQSLLPMYVHLDYLTKEQYEDKSPKMSFAQKSEMKSLCLAIFKHLAKEKKYIEQNSANEVRKQPASVRIELYDGAYALVNNLVSKPFENLVKQFLQVDHSEVFLEEPEDNLFPPTQCQFAIWLLERMKEHRDFLFVASHSPYVMDQLIKEVSDGLTIFFTHPLKNDSRKYTVRQLTSDEVQEIYGNGVDMFFNFESYL